MPHPTSVPRLERVVYKFKLQWQPASSIKKGAVWTRNMERLEEDAGALFKRSPSSGMFIDADTGASKGRFSCELSTRCA